MGLGAEVTEVANSLLTKVAKKVFEIGYIEVTME